MPDAILNSTIKYKQKIHYSAYVLALFFLLLPFEYPLADLGYGSIVKYVGILVMGVTLIDILRNQFKVTVDYRVILLGTWLVFAFASALWAIDDATYSHFFGMYRNNALMFLFVALVSYNKDEVELIKKAFIVGVLLLLLYMTFVPGATVYSALQHRLTLASRTGEELIDQNYLVAIMSMPYGFVMYDIINKKDMKILTKVFAVVFCAACLYYTVLTGSRSGLISLAMITVFCMFRGLKRNLGAVLIIILLIALALPSLAQILPEEIMERFSAEAMTGNTDESGSRLVIWRASVEALEKRGLFVGYGAGTATAVMNRMISRSVAIHNYFLAHIVELGIIGLLLFTSMIVLMLKELYKKKEAWICISFTGIIVACLFLDVLTTKFFWGAIMLLSIYVGANKASVTSEENKADILPKSKEEAIK